MKRSLTLLLLLSVTVLPLSARTDSPKYGQVISASWQNHITVGSTARFLQKYSLSGFEFNYTYYFQNAMGVGLTFSWDYARNFSPRKIHRPAGNVAAAYSSTDFYEFLPLKAHYRYMITPDSFAKLYVSAGVGALYLAKERHLQDFRLDDSSYGFLLNPEIGVLIPFGRNAIWGLNVNAGYNWATNHFSNFYANLGLYIAIF